jgi:predicted acylesterase/phospholipase RssA
MSSLVRGALRTFFGPGDLRAAPGEALALATRARDLRPIVFSSRDEEDFVEPLLGSCFLPPFYGRPIRVRGELLLDGGFTDNLPLDALLRGGAREIIAVVTSSRGTALKNPMRPSWLPFAREARVHVIHPARPLAIGYWDFRSDSIGSAIEEGAAACDRFLDQYEAASPERQHHERAARKASR